MEKIQMEIECNDILCRHIWHASVDKDRIIGNRLSGLIFCPKCGRYDSPYLVVKQ